MGELVQAVAAALEIVEKELIGVSTYHGKRIAALCALMGREIGMEEEEIKTVTTCALFHDNALTEHILYEKEHNKGEVSFRFHCESGQRNVEMLPFKSDVSGLVLYHHEQANGRGPFGKREGEFPPGAELIAIADMIDSRHHIQRIPPECISTIYKDIEEHAGERYTKTAANAMLAVLDTDALLSLNDENINKTAVQLLPEWQVAVEDDALMRLAELSARIIDHKSPFTRKHSVQIANRVWVMSGYYGFDNEMRAKSYLAAALHDLGKLATPNEILDKPGKLTDEEYGIIKDHVRGTHDMLCGITGFEEICRWAASHHEKLDGTGYCFGKKADELDFTDRMIACTDIYQAVCEERPYHPGRTHAKTMPILWQMANRGFIDSEIVKDFDTVMAEYNDTDVPPP
jgi:HD-GYP domain-containing protein (c-di-GMP phosphodiesterase class II)